MAVNVKITNMQPNRNVSLEDINPEDKDSRFLLNTSTLLPDYEAHIPEDSNL